MAVPFHLSRSKLRMGLASAAVAVAAAAGGLWVISLRGAAQESAQAAVLPPHDAAGTGQAIHLDLDAPQQETVRPEPPVVIAAVQPRRRHRARSSANRDAGRVEPASPQKPAAAASPELSTPDPSLDGAPAEPVSSPADPPDPAGEPSSTPPGEPGERNDPPLASARQSISARRPISARRSISGRRAMARVASRRDFARKPEPADTMADWHRRFLSDP